MNTKASHIIIIIIIIHLIYRPFFTNSKSLVLDYVRLELTLFWSFVVPPLVLLSNQLTVNLRTVVMATVM